MKRIFFLLITLAAILPTQAQLNIQLHYDFGRLTNPDSEADRQQVTGTIEQFIPDRLGSTFYFVDFDFYSKGMKGAYMEISREFNIVKGLAGHIEYNGGLTTGHDSEYGSQFQHNLLVGAAYNLASQDFRRTLSFQLLYKQYFKGVFDGAYPSFQATAVWNVQFGRNDMFTFSGFVDLWRAHKFQQSGYMLSVATEPQFWWNLYALKGLEKCGLSIGTEWEISNNFVIPVVGHRTFFWNPTIGIKWTLRQ